MVFTLILNSGDCIAIKGNIDDGGATEVFCKILSKFAMYMIEGAISTRLQHS